MQLSVNNTYRDISNTAGTQLIELLGNVKNPLLCTASGDSPRGLYQYLALQQKVQTVQTSGWYFVGLDEWLGMNGSDTGSCRYYLNNDLFGPLQVNNQQLCFFNGRATDPLAECSKTENFIREHGPVQVAIIGLGTNGHVGMNEPGTPANSRCHVADIDETTMLTGQKYFTGPTQLNKGLTLGIENLLAAKHIFLMVSGLKKAAIVAQVMQANISENIPATLLRNHPGLHVYLDNEAASQL